MSALKAVAVGAGYFSRFHFEAWSRIPEVELIAVCDRDEERAAAARLAFGIPRSYTDFARMLDSERPDFIDVVTRPESHESLCAEAAQRGIHVICQKPLAPTFEAAQRMVDAAEQAGTRFMVHENFRFQPWHREIKRLLGAGVIGDRVHGLSFRSRPGDGWGERAYLDRQPYFREMPRFLIQETGIHFIDTFRFLAGEVRSVFCQTRRLSPVIVGEDCCLLLLEFENGATGLWDANRYNESSAPDPRYTFGEFLVEGNGGSIRLRHDGTLTIQPLSQSEQVHPYEHPQHGFAGDCVYATQRHFVERLISGEPFETGGRPCLRNIAIQEAAYRSAAEGRTIAVASPQSGTD